MLTCPPNDNEVPKLAPGVTCCDLSLTRTPGVEVVLAGGGMGVRLRRFVLGGKVRSKGTNVGEVFFAVPLGGASVDGGVGVGLLVCVGTLWIAMWGGGDGVSPLSESLPFLAGLPALFLLFTAVQPSSSASDGAGDADGDVPGDVGCVEGVLVGAEVDFGGDGGVGVMPGGVGECGGVGIGPLDLDLDLGALSPFSTPAYVRLSPRISLRPPSLSSSTCSCALGVETLG